MIRVLKLLIDALFILLCLGLSGFIFILPFEIYSTRIVSVQVKSFEELNNLPFLYWLGIILSIITYILFLIGLNYLKKTTNFFIRNTFFHNTIIKCLKRSGMFFILSAIVLSIAYIIAWMLEASKGHIKLILGTNIMIPLFLCIVGLFFILQSEILDRAKSFKDENDLTV
ncbi:MAG TPA: DUF2975 domain-containing protein [Aequorivita sp.]|nr:DUF2975 domain-containing protein [Aequorivita sp.]